MVTARPIACLDQRRALADGLGLQRLRARLLAGEPPRRGLLAHLLQLRELPERFVGALNLCDPRCERNRGVERHRVVTSQRDGSVHPGIVTVVPTF